MTTVNDPYNNDWLENREVAKKHIKRLVKEWKPILDMGNWTFHLSFYKDKYKASAEAVPEYREAYLNLYIGELLQIWKKNYELEEFVVHEMLHCLTWDLVTLTERMVTNIGDNGYTKTELWDLKEKYEESFVQRISDALVMQKYNLKSIPDAVRFRAVRRHRKKPGYSRPKKKNGN